MTKKQTRLNRIVKLSRPLYQLMEVLLIMAEILVVG